MFRGPSYGLCLGKLDAVRSGGGGGSNVIKSQTKTIVTTKNESKCFYLKLEIQSSKCNDILQ